MLDIFSLVESSQNVADTVEKFLLDRQKGNFERSPVKRKKIVNEIMADPKKFFNFSMETMLSLSKLSAPELREKIRLAVKNLTTKNYREIVQNLVFEIEDERILRGDFLAKICCSYSLFRTIAIKLDRGNQ